MNRSCLLITIFVLTFALTPPPASAAVQMSFSLVRYRDLRTDPGAADYWLLRPQLPGSGSVRSMNGLSGSDRTPTSISSFSEHFTSWEAAQAEANAGPWTVVLPGATPAATSTYAVTPNFSGINSATFATSDVNSPAPNQQFTQAQPTFSWTAPTATVSTINAVVEDANDQAISFLGISPPTTTSWNFDEPLANGSYTFYLGVFRDGPSGVNLPISATLLSGPDRGPVTARFTHFFESATPFTVAVPEPASASAFLAGALLLLRSGRRRAA